MILEKLVIPIGFDTGLLLEGIKAIEGLISGAIERTQQWAEDMDKLGDVTGMSTDKLAAWQFVVKKAGVDGDSFSNAVVIMSKGLLDSTGELSTTGKALQNFGVDVLDAGGKVRDQSDLMNDIAKKYQEFGTQTERIDFLTNVFGKSGAKLVDVFDTLSKEGGIDKVKEKVQSLGLVLDPTQYEDFQRNLNEVDLTFTGLANAFTGPLLPAAEKLLETFTAWLQSPWVANAVRSIGENFGTFVDIIANFVASGDWNRLGTDLATFVQGLTGINITPFLTEVGKISSWVINEGIPKWNQFIDNAKKGIADFKVSSETETSAIKTHWTEMLTNLGNLLDQIFGSKGKSLIIDWKAVGITALQLVDLAIFGLSAEFQRLSDMINLAKSLLTQLGNTAQWVLGIVGGAAVGATVLVSNSSSSSSPSGGSTMRRASGGPASGLTWVGERGPELVSLPSGSNVNNNQASANMGFDYYKLAQILAVEFAKARD